MFSGRFSRLLLAGMPFLMITTHGCGDGNLPGQPASVSQQDNADASAKQFMIVCDGSEKIGGRAVHTCSKRFTAVQDRVASMHAECTESGGRVIPDCSEGSGSGTCETEDLSAPGQVTRTTYYESIPGLEAHCTAGNGRFSAP